MKEFIIAIGLVLLIEGILCAIFPKKIINMSKLIQNISPDTLRKFGFIFAIIGFIIILNRGMVRRSFANQEH